LTKSWNENRQNGKCPAPGIRICLLLFLLAGTVLFPRCGNDRGEAPRFDVEAANRTLALAGYLKDNDGGKIFTQHITGDELGYQFMYGDWDMYAHDQWGNWIDIPADTMARINTENNQYILGHDHGSHQYWISELSSTGDPGRLAESGTWHYSWETLVGFQVYGHPFIFGQDKDNGHQWFLQRFHDSGTLGDDTQRGTWGHYYERVVPMEFTGGSTYLFGQTDDKKHWFIQRVHDTGKFGSQTASGYWDHFYANTVFFKTSQSHFLFGQTKDNKHWFIQRVHSNGTMGGQTDSGYWDYYYDTVAAFYKDGKAYIFCHSKDGSRWFLNHVTADGKMAHEEDSGSWGNFWNFLFPFEVDWSYRNVSHWMGDQNSLIGGRTLKEISLPGSHDAGMSVSQHCSGGIECNTKTQEKDILEQLEAGSRYFDIRPVYDDHSGIWYTGHFSFAGSYLVGCAGQGLGSALACVAIFFESQENEKELVILDISHCLVNKTAVADDHCDVSRQDEVVDEIISHLDQYMVKCADCNLMSMTLDEISDQGGGNVIVILSDDVRDTAKGLFSAKDIDIYNEYANTSWLPTMRDDQESKLLTESHHKDNLFLYSWTLTLSTLDAAQCWEPGNNSILDNAHWANPQLNPSITGLVEDNKITKTLFPNILYVDNFDAFATRTAMYLNRIYDNLDP